MKTKAENNKSPLVEEVTTKLDKQLRSEKIKAGNARRKHLTTLLTQRLIKASNE